MNGLTIQEIANMTLEEYWKFQKTNFKGRKRMTKDHAKIWHKNALDVAIYIFNIQIPNRVLKDYPELVKLTE